LKGLGAEVVLTEGALGMKGAIDKAEDLSRQMQNSFIPQQFKNPANPEIHRKTTAEEIWADTGGLVDYFIGGVGTGGTFSGVSEVLKERNPAIKTIALEPADSPVLSGGLPGSHKIQGIGAGFIPEVLNRELIDEIIQVSHENAGIMARRLARKKGSWAGFPAGRRCGRLWKWPGGRRPGGRLS